MGFTVKEFHDLIRLLRRRPEWREELRSIILTDEILSLPKIVREIAAHVEELAKAQKRTEERVGELAKGQDELRRTVEELAEAQRRTEERVNGLAARVEELAEAQRKTEEVVAKMSKTLNRLMVDVAELKGINLERMYRERPYAYFSGLIRRARLLTDEELRDLLEEAVEKGALSDEEAKNISLSDLVVQGKLKETEEEVYLVVEVSWTIGTEDVERAKERAGMLSKLGVRVLPVVAGKGIAGEAVEVARSEGVCWLLDGRVGWCPWLSST